MKKILFFILTLICLLGIITKASANEIQVYLPGLQLRYENDTNQTVSNQQYQNYNLAAIVLSDYLIGAEFDEYKISSGNQTLNATKKSQEFNLYFGYFVFSKSLNDEYKIFLDIGPVGYIGQNRSTVETVLGAISEVSVGENNFTYAFGAQATLRIGFFIFQPEIRYAYSRSYSPSYVPIYGARIGFRIGL